MELNQIPKDWDIFDDHVETLTFDEVSIRSKEIWESMKDQERYLRMRNCDPPFIDTVIVKQGQTVMINFDMHDFIIVENK